jgi:hypothetical protein
LALWRRAPAAEGLTVDLDGHIDKFWNAAGKDPSKQLEEFLRDLAASIRKGDADIKERMLAARLIERQCERTVPRDEKAARRAHAIADFVSSFLIKAGYEQRQQAGRRLSHGPKLEMAVHAAMDQFDCSRRTVFDALRTVEKEATPMMMQRRLLVQRPR